MYLKLDWSWNDWSPGKQNNYKILKLLERDVYYFMMPENDALKQKPLVLLLNPSARMEKPGLKKRWI